MLNSSNSNVEIRQVMNGFIVREARDLHNYDGSSEPLMVFRSFNELLIWLEVHFTHRENFVALDDKND